MDDLLRNFESSPPGLEVVGILISAKKKKKKENIKIELFGLFSLN